MNRLGLGLSSGLGLLCLASGIALFTRIGANGDYVGIILPGVVLAMSGAGLAGPTLAVAAVSGIKPTEQGLATGLQETSLQAGGGLGLAITVVVVAIPTALGHGATQISAPEALVRLSSYLWDSGSRWPGSSWRADCSSWYQDTARIAIKCVARGSVTTIGTREEELLFLQLVFSCSRSFPIKSLPSSFAVCHRKRRFSA